MAKKPSWRDPERRVVQDPPEKSAPAEPVPLLERVVEWLGDRCLHSHDQHGDATVVVEREDLLDLMRWLRSDRDMAFDYLMDLTALDGKDLGYRRRFRVVYHLYSTSRNHRLRVKVPLAEDDVVVPTLVELWKGADWYEREVWDLFGVRFEGHPDLKRILLYEEFEGHPLRKDYPLKKRQPRIGPNPAHNPWRVADWPAGVGSGPSAVPPKATESRPMRDAAATEERGEGGEKKS